MEHYSKEELDFLKTENHNPPANTLINETIECNVNDLLINKTNAFKGWTCHAGLESLMINWDGDVHRATCRVGGSLGNIYKGSFKTHMVIHNGVKLFQSGRCNKHFYYKCKSQFYKYQD